MPAPQYLTVKQVAECLNVSPSLVYRLCDSGKLRHHRFGAGRGAIRVGRADLDEFVLSSRIDEQDDCPRRDHRPEPVVFKHLDLRPKHACGATTKAGTPCTVPTRGERCRRHTTRGA
jgi:excisionase family DNA binding protein